MKKTNNLKDEELDKVSGGSHQIPDEGITFLGYTNLKTCKFYASSSKSLEDIAYIEQINGTIIEYYKYTILTSESRNTWSCKKICNYSKCLKLLLQVTFAI